MLSGSQRYRQVITKARIINRRNLLSYLAHELPYCPASVVDDLITKEFERMARETRRRR